MCGIAGQVAFGSPPQSSAMKDVVQRIRHRGPDDQDVWRSPSGNAVFGHARLSVIDLSPMGHQPMIDPETGNCIVFNGEIYNFQALRSECESAGDRFRSHSDTEVILALYRRFGQDCVLKLRGMFAFAIWDESHQSVFLARDRVGKKPLNYALVDGGLIFCSEIDPLSRHPAVSREMDFEALELFLQCQYIPAPWTIYKQIRKLPPGHHAVLDRSGFRVEKYWEIDYRAKIEVTEEAALDGLEEKITEAVRLRMISDVPLGALLSGGIDSSVVVALMARLSPDPVQTFTIGFSEEAFNELPYAQQVAERCGTVHHSEILAGEVASVLPLLVRHYGEPFADSSAVPSFLVSEVARRHVTVAMNGDGGDELLGGYPRYALSPLQLKTSSIVSGLLSPQQLVDLAARVAPGRGIAGKLVRKAAMGFGWPEMQSVDMYRAFWDDDRRADLLGEHSSRGLLPAWRTEWLMAANKHADNAVERMLWYDAHTYLPGDLLTKMDIASMHCGLETRSPLLDHDVIEYCASLPVRYKVKNGVGKSLLKRLAERHFPKEFVYRRKMGFGIPLAKWLRGPLRPLLEEVLGDNESMTPLVSASIRTTLDEFLHHGIDHSSRLWSLLMYGLWRRHAFGGSG